MLEASTTAGICQLQVRGLAGCTAVMPCCGKPSRTRLPPTSRGKQCNNWPSSTLPALHPTACLQALSPVGRCKSFDSSGDGYGRGEGFVAVVMQRHAGSPAGICGIVLGSAVNQAGRSSGLTAPNGPSQSALIKTALAAAGLSSTAVRFLSVHGTGTALGDPIEIGALAQALPGSGSGRPGGQPAAPVTLASNKSCYGHTEGAAGLTGLLLAASMASQQAAPAIHAPAQHEPLRPDSPVRLGCQGRRQGAAPAPAVRRGRSPQRPAWRSRHQLLWHERRQRSHAGGGSP